MAKHSKKRLLLLAFLSSGLCLILGVLCLPVLRSLFSPDFREWLIQWVEQLGMWGVVGLFAIQVLQIVAAFIPGEPVELVAGTMYGAWGGLALCLAGILAGSLMVFTVIRRKGKAALEKSGYADAIRKYEFVRNEKKLETIIFLLYLIPGTPKDSLVYVCALTDIPLGRFLLLSTVARIPSVVSSTLAGASFASGNIGLTLGIFFFTGLIGLAGIWYHNRLLAQKNLS